jgi:protein-disulfide isomerase
MGNAIRLLATVFATVVCVAVTPAAQSQAPAAPSASVDAQILTELQQIRALLQQLLSAQQQGGPAPRPGPPTSDVPVTLTTVTGEALGNADAPLTIVEFTDLQCPYCRQFHATSFEPLKRDYIDTGKVRFVTRDFPLEQLHPLATAAARANRCAGEQQRFWEMRRALLGLTTPMAADTFHQLAGPLGLDVARFDACAADASKYTNELQRDRQEGLRIGVTATPSFVIGRTLPGGGVEGTLTVGARPYATFDARLSQLLAGPAAKP